MKYIFAILNSLLEILMDSKSIEKIRNENRERFYESALRWNEYANNRGLELSKQLFTITSFIIPLSFYPLSNNNLLASIDHTSRNILIGGWILFVGSLLFGIFSMMNGINFFNKFSEYEIKRSNYFKESLTNLSYKEGTNRLKAMIAKADNIEKVNERSTKLWFYLQVFTLFFGILALGLVLARLLKI